MSTRSFSIPENVLEFCQRAAKARGIDLQKDSDLHRIADAVMQLSDFFIEHPDQSTPWGENWAQLAYIFYYLPLNSTRVSAVIEEIRPYVAEMGLEQTIDFGAGLATASRQLQTLIKGDHFLIEKSSIPANLVKDLEPELNSFHWHQNPPEKTLVRRKPSLACFSYSLTELADLPAWAWESRAILIIEPSTQDDGRKLMQLRERLLRQDFVALAPCTHQLACPLLTQSKTDWCHDRIHLEMPEWMQRMETFMPVKNRTLTMSYLFVGYKKFSPKPNDNKAKARVVGDLMKEKGKDRQMICRGPEREFLAWFHKHGEHEEIPRGVVIDLAEDLQKVSNELRVPKKEK